MPSSPDNHRKADDALDGPTASMSAQSVQTADVKKRKVMVRVEKEARYRAVKEASDYLIQHPEKISDPFYEPIRDVIKCFAADPSKFTAALPSMLANQVAGQDNSSKPLLSSQVASRLRAGRGLAADSTINNLPVVQITKIKEETTYKKEGRLTRYTMVAVDGSGDYLLIKANTGLNREMVIVHDGTVLRLMHWTPLFYEQNVSGLLQSRCLVLLHNFVSLGRWDVPEALRAPPHPGFNNTTEAFTAQQQPGLNNDDSDGDGARGADQPTHPPEKPECHGNLCTKNGMRFVRCITEIHPVQNINLETIARDCWFVDREVSQMQNNHKRNLLYWWYQTNIYSIRGGGNRAQLPDCLLWEIRNAYFSEITGYKHR